MDAKTQFYRSQVGEASVIDYSHTDFPWKLLAKDAYYFFVYIWALPWAIWPLYPFGPKEFNELAPTLQNLLCVFIHFILAVLQLLFILALPFTILFPIWMVLTGIVTFMIVNWGLCQLLNGKHDTYRSDEGYAKPLPEHEHEQWVFLNGICVGEHWMKKNLNRLALTFGRPFLGIHNRTSGFIFDIVECLIQRNFGYANSDIRICFKILKDILHNPSKSKVIFILHSQGGIEGGLVLDWLLQELPQDLLGKLEVYTFGSAANHFNNPHRHAVSQTLAQLNPWSAMGTIMTETIYESPVSSPRESKNRISVQVPTSSKKSPSISSTRSVSAAKDRAIGHVEHYAHNTDFVAIWGILHFATNAMGSPQLPRFLGRLFSRSDRSGGHQLNQHYLDGMFPLRFDPKTGKYTGADENNKFMEEVIKIGKEGDAMSNAREAFEISWAGTQGFGTGEISTPVDVYGSPVKGEFHGQVKVKDLSRLWSYRNGRRPVEVPLLLIPEEGIVRDADV